MVEKINGGQLSAAQENPNKLPQELVDQYMGRLRESKIRQALQKTGMLPEQNGRQALEPLGDWYGESFEGDANPLWREYIAAHPELFPRSSYSGAEAANGPQPLPNVPEGWGRKRLPTPSSVSGQGAVEAAGEGPAAMAGQSPAGLELAPMGNSIVVMRNGQVITVLDNAQQMGMLR